MSRAGWIAVLVLPLMTVCFPRVAAAQAGSLTGIRIDNPVPAAGAHFGFAVAGLGDIDGDGVADFAVGAPGQGRVYLISGSSHGVLHEISDPDNLAGTQCEPSTDALSPCEFGFAVAGVGDVNGDGVDDVAVGSPGIFGGALAIPCIDPNQPCPQEGRAFIFSGKMGGLIRRLAQDGPNQGASLAALASIDADTVPDVAVVAPGDPTGKGGLVAAFAGSNGNELWTTFTPPATEGIKGLAFTSSTLAAIPDINGDGKQDIMVGAPCASVGQDLCVGRAYVLSGATGAVLRTHEDPTARAFDTFGAGVAGIGDQNGDGIADYAITEPGAAQSAASLVRLYSGATGSALIALTSPADERNGSDSAQFSMALASVSDRDGDGVADFWLGAAKSGAAYLLNGQGQVIESAADSQPGSNFGLALSALAAPPGESGLDVVVGAATRSVGAVQAAGAVFLLRAEADLQVIKTAAPPKVAPGGTLTYTVTVFNTGPSLASGVKLIDPILAPLQLEPASLSDDPACTFNTSTNDLVCTIGALAPGASFTVKFEATVPDDISVPTTVGNVATATAATVDPVPANNTAATTTLATCDVIGTPEHDVLVGTSAGETICGLGGNDILIGLGGKDVLIGGAGDDVLIGGDSDDTLLGGPGNDKLHGEMGNDSLFGGAGDDQLFGGTGTDQLDGGPGFDFCQEQSGAGTVTNCEGG